MKCNEKKNNTKYIYIYMHTRELTPIPPPPLSTHTFFPHQIFPHRKYCEVLSHFETGNCNLVYFRNPQPATGE